MVLDVATAPTRITAEQLEQWPESGERLELVRGRVEKIAPAGFEHGLVATALVHILRAFVIERRLGAVVSAETGFVIAHDPDTVRAPDVAFVTADGVVSPRHRTLQVVESRQSSRILGPDDTLDGGDLLPGFSLRVGEIFPE